MVETEDDTKQTNCQLHFWEFRLEDKTFVLMFWSNSHDI